MLIETDVFDLRYFQKGFCFFNFPFNLSFLFNSYNQNMKMLTKDYCEATLTLHISTIA